MVVRVLEIDLEDVVVDVDDRGLDLDALVAEELELHHRHRPRRVLRERLVDGDPDLAPGSELSADEVLFENRACERGHRPQYRKSAPTPPRSEILVRGDGPDGAPVGNGLVHGQVEALVALLGLGAVERAAAA